MAVDSLELQLASALQRYHSLQRRADIQKESPALLVRGLAELGTALEEVRVAQEQIVESRHRMEQLQLELAQQCAKYWELFDEMPQPYVVTRSDSIITEVNRAGAELFNVSQRFLVGKAMSLFICEERSRFLAELSHLALEQQSTQMNFKLRPRERAPLTVEARVKSDSSTVRWILSPRAHSPN